MERDDVARCKELNDYQRDVAFPNAYSVTSPMVTRAETIRTIRSQSMCLFSALLSVRTAKRAFRANLRIGIHRLGDDFSYHLARIGG
jgi:hypothetical protein